MTASTAILFGTLAATFVAAVLVSLAFFRPTLRFMHARIQGHTPAFPDRLCAGIWLSSLGASVIALVSMIRLSTGALNPYFAAVAWAGICGGYFLHFTAWRASMVGKETGFGSIYGALLAIFALGTALIADYFLRG